MLEVQGVSVSEAMCPRDSVFSVSSGVETSLREDAAMLEVPRLPVSETMCSLGAVLSLSTSLHAARRPLPTLG